ncbi:hypothetical protein GCM10009551_045880 [Nocardiopsis tropica]|uniref:peptidoglycan-binding domain-containing protein n=1 Tax=Nocardiopsis tropica TaxID=109330 RepID=UPI0031DCBB37
MATLVDNRLDGTPGTAPTPASLAASATTGAVGIANAGGTAGAGRARYDTAQTVHGLSTIRVDTSYQRIGTPRLTLALPPSGPWWARWYVWMPTMQNAGFGIDEVRLHASFPDTGLNLVIHETASGNAGTRLQPNDLAATAINWNAETGNAIGIGQWWRLELSYDGADFTSRVYAGHDTGRARVHTWNGRDVGRSLALTGYRYRRGVILRPGDTDATTGGQVSQMQRDLMALGYELPQWGADGDYGQEAANAVVAFQSGHGYGVVDGIAGPETLAGIALALRLRATPDDYPAPLWLSHVAVSDSGPIGPAPQQQDITTSAGAAVAVSGTLAVRAVQGPQQPAVGELRLTGTAPATKAARTTATGTLSAAGLTEAAHRTTGTNASTTTTASGAAAVAKGSTTTAAGGMAAQTGAEAGKHGVTTAAATARASGAAWSGGARSAIALDYAAGHVSAPFEPVDDDQALTNDVVARRIDGAEFRVTQQTGPLNAADPPLGVGRYETSVELNTMYDVQLRDHAGWRVHLGTWDEARYPTVSVDLARNPGLTENVASRESGDWLQVLNPPPWLPPGPIDLLIEGYTETLNTHTWRVEFNASSGGPWVVGVVDDPDDEEPTGPRGPDRADTEACELTAAVDADDTTLTVATTVGPPWIDSANHAAMFPLDLVLGGEIVRVTAIAGTGATQTLTVERSLNRIAKPHPAGTAVSLARPAVVGL